MAKVCDTSRIMLPLRDDVPMRTTPFVVWALIAANGLVYGYEMNLGWSGDGGAALEAFVTDWGLVPREFLRGSTDRLATGASIWLTPVSSMFLHGSLFHVLSNMLFLWIFGNNVEDLLGHGRFVVFYLVCGLSAAALHVASDPGSYVPTVGASGAVAGALGAYLVSYPRGRVLTLVPLGFIWTTVQVPAVFFLGFWFVIQLVSGLGTPAGQEGGVAWWAHVGGFVTGLVLVRPMRVRGPVRRLT